MEKIEIERKIIEQVEVLSAQKVPDNDFNIFSKGFLDSLNILHIILCMESEFSIQVNPYDLTIDTLNSINKIVFFIEEKIDA